MRQGMLGVLVCVVVVGLSPTKSEGRHFTPCELKKLLQRTLCLPKKLEGMEDKVAAMIVCGLTDRDHLNTDKVSLEGLPHVPLKRRTMRPNTTLSTTSRTISPNCKEEQQRMSLEVQLMDSSSDELGSGTMTDEDKIEAEEDQFNEEELMRDDNNMKGESNEEPIITWSLERYGLFELSDSHFCVSDYRWSRNTCETSCMAFTDDDLTDDIACLLKSGFWRFLCRRALNKCVVELQKKCEETT